jgi:hypothetical protein
MKKLCNLVFFILPVLIVCGQNEEKKMTLDGYVKYLNIISFEEADQEWINDNMFHNRLNFKYYLGNWTLAAEMRNRFVYGESVKNKNFDYAAFIDDEKGFFDLSHVWLNANSCLFHSVIDRLWIDFTKGKWQIRAGRQRINWSQAMVWNPNDIFNTYSFFDFDYEERPGSDALRIQYYSGLTSVFETVLKLDHRECLTAAAMFRGNRWNYDFQFLGGMLNEKDYVLGMGWSGEILKGGFSGEFSYFRPKRNFDQGKGAVSSSIAYNYTFINSLMLQCETLYNSQGAGKRRFNWAEFYYNELNARNLSLNMWSFFGQASYPFSPLINGSFSLMYSPNDASVYLGPACTISLTRNLQLMFNIQHFESSRATISGGKGSYIFMRLKGSF